jgi:DNA-binding LacI/PurR family transcriptional regulator/GAF domain-containing protein
MSENEHRTPGRQNGRPTIGFFNINISAVWSSLPWLGMVDAARKHDVNLVTFVGQVVGTDQANIVYDLARGNRLDGLIIWKAGLVMELTEAEIETFAKQYGVPVVTLEGKLAGAPCVSYENYQGMRKATEHLLEAHGYRKIGFLGMYEHHRGFQDRYLGYQDAMKAYGAPIEPTLVRPWFPPEKLPLGEIEEQTLNNYLDEALALGVEAVIGIADVVVFQVQRKLQERGVRVPEEIAVVGFDDAYESRILTPPVTTVKAPFYELGYTAAETLIDLLAGKSVPELVTVPSALIVRQSCGCLSQAVVEAAAGLQAAVGPAKANREEFEAALTAQREEILDGMVQALGGPGGSPDPAWAGQLLDGFAAELAGASGVFLVALNGILSQVAAAAGDIVTVQNLVSTLRRITLPYLDDETLSLAETLWQQARVMIGETAERAQAYRALLGEQQAQMLRQIEALLITTFDMGALMDVLAGELPGLGLPSVYLSLYEDPRPYAYPDPAPEWSRLMLAYTEEGRVELPSDGLRFPSRQLMPQDLWPRERLHSFVVLPLNFHEYQIGFSLFETGSREGVIYRALRTQISGVLRATMLVQEVEERRHELQEANYALQRRAIQIEASAEVGRAITSIFNIDELLQQTAALISDRFGFYHVGIFLVDTTGEWAVLREATGEAGAQMKAEGHRLAVEDTSMVGWTAIHRQPRIALDVGEDAVRFAHPLLPYTRSEMTLPLLVGDRLLGVLNVQSTEEGAFDQDDVRTLQGMADQVAIAIQNARRISDETALLESTSPVYRTSRLLTTATTRTEVADAIIASVGETGADGCTVVEFEFSPAGDPEALLYLGVWRRDREPQFQPGMRLPIAESPFPLEMVSTLWTVPDVDQDERLPRSARVVFQATGARALVNIPLRSGERVIGQVVVLRATPGPFTEAALRLYEVLSDQAAVALERAELLEEAQRRAVREQQARQMIEHIRRAVDLEQALEIAAEELSQAMQVPYVSINLGTDAIEQE